MFGRRTLLETKYAVLQKRIGLHYTIFATVETRHGTSLHINLDKQIRLNSFLSASIFVLKKNPSALSAK